jgi:DNA-binding transcriptional MerR regulator
MTQCYRIHEFAELAGVTVKALRHYDRLGLLRPTRTNGGYRMYTACDLERLEQIVALKFIGVPLKQIRIVLDRPCTDFSETLRLQRQVLLEKRRLLDRAIRAMEVAQKAVKPGKSAAPAVLKQLIEGIEMQDEIELMKKYYSTEAAWNQRRRYYEEGPSEEWRALYRDVNAALEDDPGGETAQRLADRWLALSVKAYGGDPELQTDSGAAWMDREHWPPFMKRRIAEFNLEKVNEFIPRVVLSSRRKYFSEAGWARWIEIRKDPAKLSKFWQSRVDLFREVESLLHEDASSQRTKSFIARWTQHFDTASEGDPEVKSGLINAWEDRKNWTATVRWMEEGLCMMTGARFEAAADFIDRHRS